MPGRERAPAVLRRMRDGCFAQCAQFVGAVFHREVLDHVDICLRLTFVESLQERGPVARHPHEVVQWKSASRTQDGRPPD